MTTIDLTTLDSAQLASLQTVLPDLTPAIRAERRRRSAYPTMEEGLSALAQASLQLDGVLAGLKLTAATAAVKDCGLLEVIHRLLATAEVTGVKFSTDAGKVTT